LGEGQKPECAGGEARGRGGLGAVMPRNPKRRKQNAALLAKSKLGRKARIFEDADVIRLLRAAVERDGSITAFAKQHGLPRSDVSKILSGKRPITIVVKALGLRWVCIAE
jgi:DNA-binding phage protein